MDGMAVDIRIHEPHTTTSQRVLVNNSRNGYERANPPHIHINL